MQQEHLNLLYCLKLVSHVPIKNKARLKSDVFTPHWPLKDIIQP